MGYILKGDFETSIGPSQEIYVKVDNFRISKITSVFEFVVSYWISKKAADDFKLDYIEQKRRPSIGQIEQKVYSFEQDDVDGTEIELPNFFSQQMAKEEKIEKPVYEIVKVEEEVPYVSFDDEGEEVTLYRSIFTEKEQLVKVEHITKKIIDYSCLDNIHEYAYSVVEDKLKNLLPNVELEIK